MHNDEALQAFIQESRDLIERMEEALLSIEQTPDDPEIINAIFRAAHTIKGSAGIFGLNHIVAFTHVAESVLDEVRRGHIRIDAALSSTLLSAGDHIKSLVDLLAMGEEPDDESTRRGASISKALESHLDKPTAPPDEANRATSPATSAEASTTGTVVSSSTWHISVRFGLNTIRDGFDPLSFIRFLTTLGRIEHIVMLQDSIPKLAALEPDDCHLGFELALASQANRETIEGAFEFVRDDSLITIIPPHGLIETYRQLIDKLPETDSRLGEILVKCGSLTQSELDQALDEQTAQTCAGTPVQALGEMLVERQQVPAEVVSAALTKQAQSRQTESNLIRVDAAKLDRLIDLVGELIIAGAGAALVARRHKIKELIQSTSAIASLMEDVRDSALNLRMVQIGATFNRFQRVVRDVSRDLGKDIQLRISGGETELDKTVIEKLADPLTHLVRNAMDHGIESADKRLAAGKSPIGTVSLHAYHEAGHVVVEVGDDGGGLTKEKILAKGIERGLVPPDASLSDQDIFQLIFQPGFSTAEQVSNLSGRGVGMDVVKRSINALRGVIDIDTAPSRGTTIRIRLPLTLAIIDGFLMAVGKASYVVPLNMVVECMELSRTQIGHQAWIDLRGEVLPIIRLRELYDVEGEPGRRQNVVVVAAGDKRLGLVVDHLMGELQTVIKPLGKVFHQVRGVSGFTILGNGSVSLLLDVPSLQRMAADHEGSAISHASQQSRANSTPALA